MEGSGRMLITAVGINSQAGIIFTLLGAAADDQKADAKKRKKGDSLRLNFSALACDRTISMYRFFTRPGDSKEGNVSSHHTEDGGNNMASKQEAMDASVGPTSDAPVEEKRSSHKNKSVLQAKLTKLAIQIGYAGKRTILY